MIYGNILPTKVAVSRIVLKSLLSVFIGGILLSATLLPFLAVVSPFMDLTEMDFFNYEILEGAGSMVIAVIIWTLMFASLPTLMAGVLLSGVIYRDFRLGNAYKNTAVIKGILIGGLTGLSTSLLVAGGVFYDHFSWRILAWTIPVTLIASLIGAWGGLQVYKEIVVEFPLSRDPKENNQ